MRIWNRGTSLWVFLLTLLGLSDTISAQGRRVFGCSFDYDDCDLQLILPDYYSPDQVLRWERRLSFTLANGTSFFDHTGDNGQALYAGGGSPDSVTVMKSQSSTSINCPTDLCCFTAYALMRQSTTAGNPGNLAFKTVHNSYGSQPVQTVFANVSFSSYNDNWVYIERTISTNSQNFQLFIEARNGGGGDKFFVAIDDITIRTGMCPSDFRIFGSHSGGQCSDPPVVFASQVTVTQDGPSKIATYTCINGFELAGPSIATCLFSGDWTATPKCNPKQTPSVGRRVLKSARKSGNSEMMDDSESATSTRTPGGSGPRGDFETTDSGSWKSRNPETTFAPSTRNPSKAGGLRGRSNESPTPGPAVPNRSSTPPTAAPTDCYWGENFDNTTMLNELAVTDTKLYLFSKNPLPCSGKIVRWAFLIASVPGGTPVYMSIWRPYGNSGTQFRLIGMNQFTVTQLQQVIQYSVPGDDRISVKKGDIIGIIYKQTSLMGTIHVYDTNNIPPNMYESDLYQATTLDLHIEDISDGQVVTVFPENEVRMTPLLQAFIGNDDCLEYMLPGVTFSGIYSPIPGILREEYCWSYCRKQPACFAISFNKKKRECRFYTYISDEVHFMDDLTSMQRSCRSDCGIKPLSDGEKAHDMSSADGTSIEVADGDRAFDLLIYGPKIPIRTMPMTAGECELLCRYRPDCVSLSYTIPFRPGSCKIFSNITSLIRQTGSRAFRKWGCNDVKLLANCEACSGSYQCLTGSQCKAIGRNNRMVCVPNVEGGESFCEEVTEAPHIAHITIEQCSEPPSLLNGRKIKVDLSANPAVVTYGCNDGYELIGSADVNCIDLTWQVPYPFCRRRSCPKVPNVENGFVDNVTVIPGGQQATVHCNDGYRLETGNATIFCTNVYNWSLPGTCVKDCKKPPEVTNGYWLVSQGTKDVPMAVRYYCNNGFMLYGNAECQCNDGSWTPTVPYCKAELPCTKPPPIANGAVIKSGTYDDGDSAGTCYATYSCMPGYQLVGSSTVTCKNRKWENLPFCTASCGAIPSVENCGVKILTKNNNQPTILQYSCIDGWQMDGSPVVSCVSSLWTRLPKCGNMPRKARAGMKYDCGNPPSIDNGRWVPTAQTGDFPSAVRYACSDGYYLVGPVRLVCYKDDADISWLPALVPSCRPNADFSVGFTRPNSMLIDLDSSHHNGIVGAGNPSGRVLLSHASIAGSDNSDGSFSGVVIPGNGVVVAGNSRDPSVQVSQGEGVRAGFTRDQSGGVVLPPAGSRGPVVAGSFNQGGAFSGVSLNQQSVDVGPSDEPIVQIIKPSQLQGGSVRAGNQVQLAPGQGVRAGFSDSSGGLSGGVVVSPNSDDVRAGAVSNDGRFSGVSINQAAINAGPSNQPVVQIARPSQNQPGSVNANGAVQLSPAQGVQAGFNNINANSLPSGVAIPSKRGGLFDVLSGAFSGGSFSGVSIGNNGVDTGIVYIPNRRATGGSPPSPQFRPNGGSSSLFNNFPFFSPNQGNRMNNPRLSTSDTAYNPYAPPLF